MTAVVLAQPRRFLGLRRAARLLGLSTRPLRDWIAGGWLRRDADRGRITRDELVRFVQWLGAEARPFQDYRVARLHARRGPPPRRFGKLLDSGLSWPVGVAGLTPPELARLAGCHRSLVWRALCEGVLPGRRRSPRRWVIPREAWHRATAARSWPAEKAFRGRFFP